MDSFLNDGYKKTESDTWLCDRDYKQLNAWDHAIVKLFENVAVTRRKSTS